MIDLQKIKNQQEYTRILEAMANTYKYTPAQQLAIFYAFPQVTAVATLEQWNQYGRRIRRGSRGLPIEKDGKRTYLFDINQTYVYDSRKNNFPRWTYNHKCNDVLAKIVCSSQGVEYNPDYRFEENLDKVVGHLSSNVSDDTDMSEFIRSSAMFVSLTRLDFDISDHIFDFSYAERLSDRELAGALTQINTLTTMVVSAAIKVQRNYSHYASIAAEQTENQSEEALAGGDIEYNDEIAASVDTETVDAEDAVEPVVDSSADEEETVSIIEDPEPSEPDSTGLMIETVTDEELIEKALIVSGTGFVHGKFRIKNAVDTVKSSKERIAVYKQEFGTGGTYSSVYSFVSDNKGIEITYGREDQDGYRKFVLNWSSVDSILRKLVESEKYISVDEAQKCIRRMEQDGIDHSRKEFIVAQDIIYTAAADELIASRTNITVPSDTSDRKKILEDLHDALLVLRQGKSRTGYFLWIDMNTALDSVMRSSKEIADILTDCKRIVELAMSDDTGNLTKDRFDEALAAVDYVIAENMLARADDTAIINNSVSDRISKAPVVYDATNRNYDKLKDMFPEFMERRTSYERYEVPDSDCFDPLTLEWISDTQIQIAHHYIQNGDVMYDPAICFEVDEENKKLTPVSYENHGLGIYEVLAGTDNQRERSADLSSFTSQWLDNIKGQGYALIKAISIDGSIIEDSITEEEMLFSQADLAKLISERSLSSDEWEDMAHPLFENGYLDKHNPSDKAILGYHLREPELYELAKRYRDGDDIRRELALGLLEGSTTTDIEFVFEDGKISDRTYYYAENLRHSLHLDRTENGYNCSFGGMERFISFEEIGQAFIGRTHEEFNDLAFWWVRDDMLDAIPDISDEKIADLISAFDGAALHGWENGDNQAKINRIKKALFDVLGDDEQTEKAFACIAKHKYNVSVNAEKTQGKYQIYQLPDGDKYHSVRFEGMDQLKKLSVQINQDDYELVYEGEVGEFRGNVTLEAIYTQFNTNHPEGFRGHSLSVSDVVVIDIDGERTAYYCDTAGFTEMPEFFREKEIVQQKPETAKLSDLAVGDVIMYDGARREIEEISSDRIKMKDLDAPDYGGILLSTSDVLAYDGWQEDMENKGFEILPKAEKTAPAVEAPEIEKGKTKKSFSQQVDDVLAGKADRYDDLKVCDTPQILIDVGCEQLPMLYTKNHLKDALHKKSPKNPHWHGLTVEQIKQMPTLLENPAILMDSISPNTKAKGSIVAAFNAVDNDNAPLLVIIKPNGKGHYELQQVNSNFITSIYGKDNNFTGFIERSADSDSILFWDKQKSQELFSLLGLQLPKGLNNLDPNIIIHQSRNIVNNHEQNISGNKPRTDLNELDEPDYWEQMQIAFEEDNEAAEIALEQDDIIALGGRNYTVTNIDEEERTVDLRDDNGNYYPTTRTENIADVEAVVKQKQRADELAHRVISSPRLDYVITNNGIGTGTPKERYRRNIEAIKLLKQIESENRLATADEQQILAQYVGWGGLSEAFDQNKWANQYAQLRELLTEEEYEAAGNSVLSAFYTKPVVIKSIYKALDSFGFKGGNVLEPAMGTGNFFGCMPENIRNGSRIYGIEIDSISGRIANQLYQNANIEINGYENTTIPDNFIDVAIGNVPFGDFSVDDKRYNKQNLRIHDYFFAKTIDKVRAGGIIAFITSKGTLDKANSKVRDYISERCILIGAVRLPNDAFKESPGTVSDIIFLQKREAITSKIDNWVGLEEYVLSPSRRYKINSYYIDNPNMVCGKLDEQSSRYGYELTCKPFEDKTLEAALNDCINALIGKVQYRQNVSEVTYGNPGNAAVDSSDVYSVRLPATGNVGDGGYTVIDGIVYVREGSELVPQKYNSEALEKKVIKILNIHASARDIIRSQYEGISDSELAVKQEYLNNAYDEYLKKYGALTPSLENTNLRQNIISFCTALEDEHEDENKVKTYTKAKIFSSRTIRQRQYVTHCDTVSDAFIVCMQNKAHIDLDYISSLCYTPKEKVIEVLNGVQIFRVPDTEEYVTADEYLSGNVRKKLETAKAAALSNPEYSVNVTALEGVQPEWVYAEEISIQLGSSWIPPKYIRDFIRQRILPNFYGYGTTCDVQHHVETATWNISDKNIANKYIDGYETYGTTRMNALHILEHTLNMQSIAIFDKVIDDNGEEKRVFNRDETAKAIAKQDIIKQMFADWIWTSPARKKDLEEIYNREINNEVVRQFDGSHLLFDGMSSDIELKYYQKNVVARAIYSGNTLIAHCVGAGKTYEMTAIAMEMRRVGVANKPLFVVPNHLIGQWSQDFLKLYPNADILAATSQDFKADNRKRFISRIATGDYDAIIMGHSTFGMLQVSKAKRIRFYEEEIQKCVDYISSTNDKKSLSFKQVVGLKKKYEKSLKALEFEKSEDVIEFEQLGIDALFIDEAHEFKNLATQTRLGRIGGISTSAAKRSEDLLLKIRYISEVNGGNKGVVFATGTPVSNSLVELYTMQRYLQPDYLAERGLQHFDSWAANFVNIETVIELDPTGKNFRPKKRCSSFNNVPELMVQFRRCADIQTPEMLNLPIPKLKNNAYTVCVTEPSEEQKDYINDCANRAGDVKNKLVDPHEDNMLKITTDGKMCAIDMRLVDPEAEDNPDSKINLAVENIIAKYHEFEDEKLTQAVFLDRSTPTNTEWNLYDDIRNKLVSHGIPKEEIKFVHEAQNDEQKIKLFSDVNSGKVRIIIGSTSKMGAGTNMQERLCALHHLDVPWRPSDIEQREGRILRRGNTCAEVEIFRYVTRDTFDAYSWQTIEYKQKMISQIMTDKIAGRSVDDVDEQALNYAEIKMLATGDTRIKEQLELSTAVARLKLQKGQHNKLVAEARKQLNIELPKQLSYSNEQIKKLEQALEYSLRFPKAEEEESFVITVGGKEYTKKREGGRALLNCCNQVGLNKIKVGQYRGFDIELVGDQLAQTHIILSAKGVSLDNYLGASELGTITRLDNLIDDKLKEKLEKYKETLQNARQEIDRCNSIVNMPFQFESEYREKLQRLNEINRELALDERSNEAALMGDVDTLDLEQKKKR